MAFDPKAFERFLKALDDQETGGVASKRRELEKQVAKAKESGDKNLFNKVKGIAGKVGAGAGNPILRALSALDLGRAAVVSGVKEASDLVGGGADASFGDFIKQTKAHVGVGDYVKTGNKWVDRGIGFVGDTALDPLTYATFGASTVAKAGARGSALTSKTAARKLLAEGMEAEAKLAARKGASAVPKEALEAIGARAGVGVRIPGTTKQALIPGTDKAAQGLAEIGTPIREALVNSAPVKRVSALFELSGPGVARAKQALRASDPEGAPLKIMQFDEARRAARLAGHRVKHAAALDLGKLYDEYHGTDTDELYRAMNGDTEVAGDASQRLGAWFEGVATAAEEAVGGVRTIGRREDYLPIKLTEALKEHLTKNSGNFRGGKMGPEMRASLMAEDAHFLGEPLVGKPFERLAQVEQLSKAIFGDSAKDVFVKDPWELANSYLHFARAFVEKYGFDNELRKVGLEVDPVIRGVHGPRSVRAQAETLVDSMEGLNAKFTKAKGRVPKLAETRAEAIAQAAKDAADGGKLLRKSKKVGAVATAERAAATDAQYAADGARIEEQLVRQKEWDAAEDVNKAIREVDTTAAQIPTEVAPTPVASQPLETLKALAAEQQALKAQVNSFKQNRVVIEQELRKLNDEARALAKRVQFPTTRESGATLPPVGDPADIARLDEISRRMASLSGELEPTPPKVDVVTDNTDVAPGNELGQRAETPPSLADREAAAALRLAGIDAEAAPLKEAVASAANPSSAGTKSSQATVAAKRLETQQRAYEDAVWVHGLAEMAVKRVDRAAEDNATKLAALEALANEGSERAIAKRAEAIRLRQQAKRKFLAAAGHEAKGEHVLAKIANLEAVADTASLEMQNRAIKARDLLGKADQIEDMIDDGLRELANGQWGEEWLSEALTAMAEVKAKGGIPAWLKTFDAVTNRWKAYSLVSPGFHSRNFLGGMFNNALGGVQFKSYMTYGRNAHRVKKAGGDLSVITDPKVRQAFEAMRESGVTAERHIPDLSDVVGGGNVRMGSGKLEGNLNPLSFDNKLLHTNAAAAGWVEDELRGTMFLDRYLANGGDLIDARDAVIKYHFDYDELSAFEKDVLRRIIPFYTWTRKNFPLQLESMVTRPGAYTKYLHLKRNLEKGTPEEDVVPSYYSDLMAIRLPLKSAGGDRLYATPDLPFRDIAEQFNVSKLKSSLNPIIKLPLELSSGKQFYSEIPFKKNLGPVPAAYTKVPGLVPALKIMGGNFGLPKIVTGKGGKVFISDADAYKIDTALPLLGRMRRLFPNEERYQGRAMTTWLSFMTGTGVRTLDSGAKWGELSRRTEKIRGIFKRVEETG